MRSINYIFLILIFFFGSYEYMTSQDVAGALHTLRDIRHWSKSLQKDSALVFEYNYLAEAYSWKKDSLARLYIDSIQQLVKTSSWNKTEGLYIRAVGNYLLIYDLLS